MSSSQNSLSLAEKCTNALHQKDYMAQSSGMQPKSIAAGESQVTMSITKEMLNGLGTCHGGMIFSLADTAFAHACNNRNLANVAMDCRIDFLSPAYEGDTLTAHAKETHQGRKSSLYEIIVKNQTDKILARFQGRSYFINRHIIDEPQD